MKNRTDQNGMIAECQTPKCDELIEKSRYLDLVECLNRSFGARFEEIDHKRNKALINFENVGRP